MNFRLYNKVTNKLETNFKILPNGDIENEWGGISKPDGDLKLLLGTEVMDGDREIFEHDLYLDDDDNLHEVTFINGSFVFENDYDNPFYVHEDCDVLRRSKFIGNVYTVPEIYQKYKND